MIEMCHCSSYLAPFKKPEHNTDPFSFFSFFFLNCDQGSYKVYSWTNNCAVLSVGLALMQCIYKKQTLYISLLCMRTIITLNYIEFFETLMLPVLQCLCTTWLTSTLHHVCIPFFFHVSLKTKYNTISPDRHYAWADTERSNFIHRMVVIIVICRIWRHG